MIIYECTLPIPPTINAAYGQKPKKQRYKSKKLKQWLEKAPDLILPEIGCIDFPVQVEYTFYFKCKRKRDITNYVKVVEDYLCQQCVLLDDNNRIVKIVVLYFGGIDKDNPRVEIKIYDI